IIVFCPITSRVGSDVEAAMKNIPWDKKIVLVLMHHTRDPDYSTAGTLWSETYPNIDLEVHVLFHESVPGLLTSSKNTDAVYRMQKYLQPREETKEPMLHSLSSYFLIFLLPIQINVHTITSGETFGADEELLSKVRKRTQLTVTHWLESLFIIVFCPITSRVGSDVEAAMNKVPGEQNVILVLMHHTRDEGYSTAGTIWSDQYPNVILDVHVLFHETVPGLLQCAKNTEAVDQLVRELDQRS
uniref:Uncharacterized protein n=1 Tax=Poecilia formosa TaxID=48698 RepID=A0A096MFZ0_POEFO